MHRYTFYQVHSWDKVVHLKHHHRSSDLYFYFETYLEHFQYWMAIGLGCSSWKNVGQCVPNLTLGLGTAISDSIIDAHLFQVKLSFLRQQDEVQILEPLA